MNRRERRAAIARGQCFEPPAGYVRTVACMATELRSWIDLYPEDIPRFALPDRKFLAAACIDQVMDRIARNDSARILAARFCEIGIEVGGPGAQPTLTMLSTALDLVDVPWEVVALKELGEWAVVSRGTDGDPS